MSGYADETEAAAVLAKAGVYAGDMAAQTVLAARNADLSAEIDDYTKRGPGAFRPGGAVTWTRDAPLGAVLPLPDFTSVSAVTINGLDVTARVRPRALTDAGPPYQYLLYVVAGVPTGWSTGLTAAQVLDAVVVQAEAGYAAVPGPVQQTATETLCRLWRARVAQYSGSAGDALTSVVSGPPYLDAEGKRRLAPYVRPRVVVITGGGG